MQWVRDTTGRFAKRPHYLPEELDQVCETVIKEFLLRKHGEVRYPITTDDLTCLLERDVQDLDLYADFSSENEEIEGVTEFRFGRKPIVKISARLTTSSALENRLRTTLTHEFGHVHLHNQMFQVETKPAALFPELVGSARGSFANRCHRDSMHSLDKKDWLEWQAGFVCGAILIPITSLIISVQEFREKNRVALRPISEASTEGAHLITAVAKTFQTSKDAARVRLLQKRMLTPHRFESLL